MFWSSTSKSLLQPEQEAWQLDCWRWLEDQLSDRLPLADVLLIQPSVLFFPATDAVGHDLVRQIFQQVAKCMRVAPQAFDLVPHDDLPKNARRMSYAAGTYSGRPGGRARITYLPSLANDPAGLVPVLAHEICHGIFRSLKDPPPGGWEMEEFAVELMTVYFGFGIFSANKAFEAAFGKGWRGWLGTWSVRSSGYLSQEQWAFALAVFLKLRGEDPGAAWDWLKPQPQKMLKQSISYIDTNPLLLASLQR